MLAAHGIQRSFSLGAKTIPVLKGIDLVVGSGERLFLTGSSGAGKTTLLYILAGLEQPDEGEVTLDGVSVYRLPRRDRAALRNRRMGYIFQNYCLLPELTALENVDLPAVIGGGGDPAKAAALLGQVGLGPRTSHLPAELSGGEQQRVAIARALANDPDVIFADEPTGNLDSASGQQVMSLLLSVVADSGKTLIVVTHDAELAQLGDRHITISDGRVVC
jgi:putative ABC transport system ATP-binding protein/lipoprotein-releasing system ATP-binding protein